MDFEVPVVLSVMPPACSQVQFAGFLGVTKDTVRGWVESDTLPTVKIGKNRYIDVDRYLRDVRAGKTIFCSGDYRD